MDSKTWERIKSELRNAHPLARIRKLHLIIRNPKIPKKIRDEAKELAKKARLELDQEHFWRWGGVSLPLSQRPQLEEEVREERPIKTLEQTVETAAPTPKKEEEEIAKSKYISASGEEYTRSYMGKTPYDRETKPAETPRTPREELMATPSEKFTEPEYQRRRRAREAQESY